MTTTTATAPQGGKPLRKTGSIRHRFCAYSERDTVRTRTAAGCRSDEAAFVAGSNGLVVRAHVASALGGRVPADPVTKQRPPAGSFGRWKKCRTCLMWMMFQPAAELNPHRFRTHRCPCCHMLLATRVPPSAVRRAQKRKGKEKPTS